MMGFFDLPQLMSGLSHFFFFFFFLFSFSFSFFSFSLPSFAPLRVENTV